MNQFKENVPEEKVSVPAEETMPSRGFFSLLFSGDMLTREAAIRALPYFMFLAAIAMFYISNRHHAEKNVREIDRGTKELKELRWEYMTAKAELMHKSKQTEVAKKVEHIGLKESTVPPKKIVVKK